MKAIPNYQTYSRACLTNLVQKPLWFCLVLGVVVLTGCVQKVRLEPEEVPSGTFTLVSVDGQSVPCTVNHGKHPLTVHSGRLIILADGTCTSRVTFSPTPDDRLVREVAATYTRDGRTLTMKWEGAGVTTGSYGKDTFTMNNEGMVFSYRR